MVVAIPDDWIDVQTMPDLEEIAFEFKDKKRSRLRIATKYPNLTTEFMFSRGVTQFKLVKSLGATEIYPFTGSSELITDITSTGATLKVKYSNSAPNTLYYGLTKGGFISTADTEVSNYSEIKFVDSVYNGDYEIFLSLIHISEPTRLV